VIWRFNVRAGLRKALNIRGDASDERTASEVEKADRAPDTSDGAADPQSAPDIPLPPPGLRYRVAGTEAEERFLQSGVGSVRDLERALASVGRSYMDFNDILEWGCGCGRILRHLPVLASPRTLYGNDIDKEAIDWLSKHMPWVETSLTEGKPPLPYRDGSFDLVFNHSVLSHLDEDYQDAWLAELARVLRPGGVITLTVHGQHAFDQYCSGIPAEAPLRQQAAGIFYKKGLYYMKDDEWDREFPDFYHTAFHSVRYVFDHWSKFLRISQYIPRGVLDYQDMVVLRKLE